MQARKAVPLAIMVSFIAVCPAAGGAPRVYRVEHVVDGDTTRSATGSGHVALRDQHPELAGLGRLAQFEPSGKWRFIADIGAYEAANNPDGGLVDSNPYGLLAEPGGHVLTDASGNTLLRLDANGAISALAVFQSRRTPGPLGPESSFASPATRASPAASARSTARGHVRRSSGD